MISLIISLVFLLLCSAFFSASETAFSSVNRIKLKNLASRGNKRALRALKLAESYDKLLSTVLIGNNVVNIASSALATVLFVGFLGNAGVSVATLVMTILVLLAGEISPKTLAKEAPEQFAMFSAPILVFLVWVLSPLNRLITRWKKLILKLFRIKADHSVSEEEFLTFVGEVRQEGGINEREEDMIRQAIEFDDLTANDIFTPRVDVAAVSLSDSVETMERIFHETGYSRLPVYTGSIDHITGVILLKDFHYRVISQGQSPADIVKPVVFVSKYMKVPKLLKTMQEKKSHMAVLVDEFGGTMGIITIEDIVEELVGEIWDEHDQVEENIIETNSGTYKILGNTGLEDMFEFFALGGGDEKNKADRRRYATVGGWVIERLGGVPREGDRFVYDRFSVTVSKIRRHRVMEVTVSPIPQ
ncbi:MAG: hemolysin family protein [Spirochaetaceae bacterium]|jgi:CBS domain containing-hemolysin-like protein|nr:hemolysin family protein [Spirochaetaceae bacterium]